MPCILKSLFLKLFDKFYYFELDVESFVPEYKNIDENFQFRQLTGGQDDMERLKVYAEYRKRGFLSDNVDYLGISRERLEKEDEFTGLVLIDKRSDEIAYLRWIQFTSNYSEMMRYQVALDKDDAYLIDSYTVPKYRSMGLHKFMMFRTADYCRSLGIKRIYGGVIHTNQYAINVMNQVGYRVKKTLYRFRYYLISNRVKSLFSKK